MPQLHRNDRAGTTGCGPALGAHLCGHRRGDRVPGRVPGSSPPPRSQDRTADATGGAGPLPSAVTVTASCARGRDCFLFPDGSAGRDESTSALGRAQAPRTRLSRRVALLRHVVGPAVIRGEKGVRGCCRVARAPRQTSWGTGNFLQLVSGKTPKAKVIPGLGSGTARDLCGRP